MTSAFIFKEYDLPDAMRVELRDDDAPYGRPQEVAGFETGGEVEKKRVKLPGRREPLYHVLASDDRPLVIKGAFRDYRMGSGHAKEMKKRIELMRGRANLLRLVWDGDQWTGLMVETLFGEEGPGHITYELHFDIALPPDVGAARPQPPRRGDSSSLDAILAQLRARPPAPVTARGLLAGINRAMTAVEGAMEGLADAQRSLENTRDNVTRQVRRVTSLGAQVQQLTQQARRSLDDTVSQAKGFYQSAKDTVEWDRYSKGLFGNLQETAYGARDANQSARSRLVTTERLYRVKPGDTLESIAREQLGDAGRAGELGLTAAQLTVGRVLRIPGPR